MHPSALDIVSGLFTGRFLMSTAATATAHHVVTAFLPLSTAKSYYKAWVNANGKNRYAKLFDMFTHVRPSYRIYLPISKHLRIDTEFSAIEIDVINAFHVNGGKYDVLNYYENKAVEKKNGRVININKALQELAAPGHAQAIAAASRKEIMDKIRAATYSVSTAGGKQMRDTFARYDEENRCEAEGKIRDDEQVVWDRRKNKPRKIDKTMIDSLSWTELDRLIDAVASDRVREGSGASNADMALVISRHPLDIAAMSTDRPWNSCTNLGGPNRHTGRHDSRGSNADRVMEGVKYGMLVAYAIHSHDGNIHRPLCRVNIMPFVNSQDKDDIVLDITSGKNYGKWPAGFEYMLRKWLNMVNRGNKGGTYKVLTHDMGGRGPYLDAGGDRVMPPVSQNADAKEWMNKLGVKSFKVRPDGRIDVNGDVNLSSKHIDERFMILPIKFGTVKGNFKAANCNIAQMAGFPERVEGDFDISNNKITSLEDGPVHVTGNYIARKNDALTVLTGWPLFIGGNADFESCGIASMRGIPRTGTYVGGSMLFQKNKNLRRIDGFPETVECKCVGSIFEEDKDKYAPEELMGRVDFSYCNILTTVGLPSHIKGDLMMRDNQKLADLVGFPDRVEGHVLLSRCPLRDLSVAEGVYIGGTFQFNEGNLHDTDVARFKPKHIGGGVQFANHYLTKKCPTPPNVERAFPGGVALWLGTSLEDAKENYVQKTPEKKTK